MANAFCEDHVFYGINVAVCKKQFGYEYDFTYEGTRYFAHYPYASVAEWGARTKIEELLKKEDEG